MAIIPFIILSAVTLANCKQTFERHQVLKVWAKTKQEAFLLHKLEDEGLVDLWSHVILSNNEHTFMSLDSIHAESVYQKLDSENIPYDIHSDNLQRMVDESQGRIKSEEREGRSTFRLYKYNTIEEIKDYLSMLPGEYNQMVELKEIGVGPVYKHPMQVVKINTKPGQQKRPIVFVDCGIHAREWVAVSYCLYLIHQLTAFKDEEVPKAILDKYEIHILPVYNTDGYYYSWNHNRMWRKNRHVNPESQCIGVDLNRNFDINFGGQGSSNDSCSPGFAGPSGNSEEETKAFVGYLETIKPIKIYFNIHAYSQLWLYPYGYKKEAAKNAAAMKEVSRRATKAIMDLHGANYTYGDIYDTIYPASGTTMDYVYDKIPADYAFALELRDKGQYGFLLPEEMIQVTVEEVFAGLVETIKAIDEQ